MIRVRVAGAAGDTAASEDKISAVAQEIVRATGLHVQPVLGTTVTTRVVALPAGLHGRPPLLVDEVWYRSDVRTTVWTGLGLDSIVLVELQLLAGEVGIGWGTWRLLRSRRRELATLRALGWRRQTAGRAAARRVRADRGHRGRRGGAGGLRDRRGAGRRRSGRGCCCAFPR